MAIVFLVSEQLDGVAGGALTIIDRPTTPNADEGPSFADRLDAANVPMSNNIEDRRGEDTSGYPNYTLRSDGNWWTDDGQMMVRDGTAPPADPQLSNSSLARDAGINDIGGAGRRSEAEPTDGGMQSNYGAYENSYGNEGYGNTGYGNNAYGNNEYGNYNDANMYGSSGNDFGYGNYGNDFGNQSYGDMSYGYGDMGYSGGFDY